MVKRLTIFISSIILIATGCSPFQEDVKVSSKMNKDISEHIKKKYKDDNVIGQFEVHKVYGATQKNGLISVYLYSVYKEISAGSTELSGHSLPVLIRLKKEDDHYKVTNYQEPEDGSRYLDSLKSMFPKKYVNRALNDSGKLDSLNEKIDLQVKEWLKKN